MSKRVLIVEDDRAIARVLRDNLVYDGFSVECAWDGEEALAKAREFAVDLVLLDLMLPGLDGFAVCRELTQGPARTPVIILTVRSEQEDKVRGLEFGADDYVTKPFALKELLARVHAVLRRTQPLLHRLVLGDTLIDFVLFHASRCGVDPGLTHREFELLRYLAERAGKVVSREELLRMVWGYRDMPFTRTVDNFVARLRHKIEPDPHHPRFLRTAHGGGYCLTFERPMDGIAAPPSPRIAGR